MRYKHPKTEMHANGIYGGVGTRPGHEPWTPGGKVKKAKREWVSRVLRRLRLRRTRPRGWVSDYLIDWPALLVILVAVSLVIAYLVRAARR